MAYKSYTKFEEALRVSKKMKYMSLMNDINSVKNFLEKLFAAAIESSQTIAERDYGISSL